MIQDITDHTLIESGKKTIEIQRNAAQHLIDKIDKSFAQACRMMLACQGKIIVTGMGKSGHIGQKIAATLASTGTPAFFVHPGEACHGDLGMITGTDLLLALSYSGETKELQMMLSSLQARNTPTIAITNNANSTLAKKSKVHLALPEHEEACPLGLAPTTSSTLSLLLGDALAMALLNAKGFTPDDFARSHPGGNLGKRLLMCAEDIMHQQDAIPCIQADATIEQALLVMSAKRLGMTTVLADDRQTLLGIFTDGDLRRTLEMKKDIHETPINAVMQTAFQTASKKTKLVELLDLMRNLKITSVPITTEQNKLIGIVHMHNILQEGIT